MGPGPEGHHGDEGGLRGHLGPPARLQMCQPRHRTGEAKRPRDPAGCLLSAQPPSPSWLRPLLPPHSACTHQHSPKPRWVSPATALGQDPWDHCPPPHFSRATLPNVAPTRSLPCRGPREPSAHGDVRPPPSPFAGASPPPGPLLTRGIVRGPVGA